MWDLNTIHAMEDRSHEEYLQQKPTTPLTALREKLNELLLERRGLLIFLNVMFEFRPGLLRTTEDGATPGTPGNAAARPTTS